MQVDHINENTIRVRINKDELVHRGLKVLDLLGDKQKIQQFFYSILSEVDTDHTFTQGVPVTFQVMPNNGGLDLMITKIKPDDADNLRQMIEPMNSDTNQTQAEPDSRRSFFDLDPKDDVNTELDPIKEEQLESSNQDNAANTQYWKFQNYHSYSFDKLGNIVELADSLKVSDLASSLYYLRGKYYLKLAFLDENYAELKPADTWAIANEYGIKIDDEEMKTVKETGKCLLNRDALEYIRYYFLQKK
ncbi:adaptor protein MecA [Lactobacillus helveticus]|uniref:Adaptor protein MecA n=1 Tax=Lactobacillus helveticus TaxID=1587 RepID=A0AAV4E5M7_LACHE|nr:adaptor protein MecA [Lactobacillus helveticus]EGF34066.1 adaptor protein [Lactobacillus helveticus MTCC 5463]AGQ23199.1 putative competence regulatory protein [Lactobacillus helveticus CNRZ32]AHI11567.1 Competence negative regulator MecA [Lactobacillus helveticus H9]AKG66420.1 adaptor protein [Lactobacillus helveticus]KXN79105.1 adaptor protein MecA [Lactobacillus helveticus]